jgi:hypothetical protein
MSELGHEGKLLNEFDETPKKYGGYLEVPPNENEISKA